ncbi:hypothetical protein HID58_095034 [Brassica napus]|uniref:Mevalonate kinase n=1 Tax=Brassica napus TaxID=3708 RepID=A0ABQ7X501_BRANA|nr:hypothetical protein HID58_095034 [Brassica napus]
MHSFGYRANALLTFAVTILAFICAIASFSDNFSNQTPSAQIQILSSLVILNINWFQKQPHGNDEVFAFVAAEYETSKNSLNQVSLWDAIIPEKEEANFWIQISNKYRFIDQGHNLRGKDFNLTLHWHVMPKTGKMFADKIVMSGYRLPNANMEVKARAPGKIILAGEHAVVHGSTAVAAAIDLYTYVTLRLPLHSDENNDRLTLQLKDLSLEFTWSVSRLKEGIAYDSSNRQRSSSPLGSLPSSGYTPASLGEKIIHGKPSGIDNTVSAYGNMIKFCSGEITRLKSNMPLRMLITNTKVGRNTKALVSGVSERKVRHPEAMNYVFNAVDSISKEVAAIIQTKDDISVTEKEESVKELMEMNQGLLESMGVSHSSIDTVIQTTLKHKLTSKLTGAGGTVVEKVVEELESSGFQCFTASIGGKGAEICF